MKRIGSIIAFLFAVGMIHSQTTDFRPELYFGVNAGATLSRVSFMPRVPQTFLLQGSGGLTARYISEKNCGILIELNYSMRGWQEEPDGVIHFNRYTRSLSYIELPVLTHFYIDLGKRTRMAVNLGPQVSYNIGEWVLDKEITRPPANPDKNYYDDHPVQRRFDYGIAAGLGLEVRTDIGSFILEGRYFFGLSDIFNNTRADIFQASHNQVIGIKLGYLVRWR